MIVKITVTFSNTSHIAVRTLKGLHMQRNRFSVHEGVHGMGIYETLFAGCRNNLQRFQGKLWIIRPAACSVCGIFVLQIVPSILSWSCGQIFGEHFLTHVNPALKRLCVIEKKCFPPQEKSYCCAVSGIAAKPHLIECNIRHSLWTRVVLFLGEKTGLRIISYNPFQA